MYRFWSSSAPRPAGRTPGVTMRKPRPHSRRMRAISSGDATTPSMPALRARRASRTTWSSTSSATPTRRRSLLRRLVSTVTARIFGRRRLSRRQTRVTSALVRSIISKLPEACRSKNRTPRRAASTPARATVWGMSWNLRSRNTSTPWRWIMRTTSGPECRMSCFPTLKTPTSFASSATRRSASANVSTSSAKISRWRMLSVRGGRNGQRVDITPPPSSSGAHQGGGAGGCVRDRYLDGVLVGAPLELDDPVREAARPDRDAHGEPDQVGVLELDARALVAVVEERVDPSGLQLRGDPLGGLSQLRVGSVHRDHPGAVGRERRRPDHARVVVVLLDRGRDGARDPDPVASHLDRPLDAVGAEEARPHRRAVLGAEVEDLSDLDATVPGEDAFLAARAAVARTRLAQVREGRAGEIAPLLDADEMGVVAVRAGDHAARAAQRGIGEDRDREADRAREADRGPGRPLDLRLVRERHRLAADRTLHLRLGRVVVAADEHRDDAPVRRPVEQRRDEAVRRHPERRRHLLHPT